MNAPAPELLAKRSGRCHLCKGKIRGGQDYISKIAGRHWCHSICAAGYRRTIAENEESPA